VSDPTPAPAATSGSSTLAHAGTTSVPGSESLLASRTRTRKGERVEVHAVHSHLGEKGMEKSKVTVPMEIVSSIALVAGGRFLLKN
jgi:hypothetical protein